MPHVNLSALSGRELRAQLDSCRARGDAAAAYGILQEMAARRQAGRSKGAKRAAEPRVVEVDMGDPLDDDADEIPPAPHWRAPEYVRAEAPPPTPPEPAPVLEAEPLVLTVPEGPAQAAEPLPPLDLPERPTRAKATKRPRRARPERPPAPVRPRGGWRVAAGFAIGITAGVALGWGAAGWRAAPAPAAEPAPRLVAEVAPAPVTETAQAAPAELPAPVFEPEPAEAAVAPEVQTADVGEAAEAVAAPVEAPVEAMKVEAAERSAGPDCAAQPTPADREICRDARLQKLQRELRRAYSAALDAHEDRALLRQRQLAWREARNDIADPSRLARLYEQRIEKLDAAASAARAQH